MAGKDIFIIVDATTGTLLHRLVAPNKEGEFNGWFGPIRSVNFDPTGRLLVATSDNQNLWLWEIGRERPIAKLGEDVAGVYSSAAFSHDGRFVATLSYSRVVQIWEVATQKLLRKFPVSQAGYLAFSRDDQALFVGSTLYDFATGLPIRHFTDHMGNVAYAFFAQEDETMVVITGTTVEIVPTLARLLAYADALILREPPTFTEWELRHFELGETAIRRDLQIVAAEPLNAAAPPPVLLTPRPRPDRSMLSPLPTPRP